MKVIKSLLFLPSPPPPNTQLFGPHAESLLRYCVVWNTNARNCQDAQAVLQVLLTHVPPEELLQYQGARAHLEGLIPYTGQQRACAKQCRVFILIFYEVTCPDNCKKKKKIHCGTVCFCTSATLQFLTCLLNYLSRFGDISPEDVRLSWM